jgi:hypothetical protein
MQKIEKKLIYSRFLRTEIRGIKHKGIEQFSTLIRDKLNQLFEYRKEIESEIDKNDNELLLWQSEAQKLQNRLLELGQRRKDLDQKYESLYDEDQDMAKKYAVLQQHYTMKKEKLKKEEVQLEEKISNIKTDFAELKKQKAELKKEINAKSKNEYLHDTEIKSEIQKVQNRILELEQRGKDLEQKSQILQHEDQDIARRYDDLEEDCKIQEAKLKKEEVQLEEKISNIQTDFADLKKKETALNEEIEKSNAKSKNEYFEQTKQNLETKIKEIDNDQLSIENEIIQEVIGDIMSLTEAKVDEPKLWEEIKAFQESWKNKAFQESWKKLKAAETKLNIWYKKFSVCEKVLERYKLEQILASCEKALEKISLRSNDEQNKLAEFKKYNVEKIIETKDKIKSISIDKIESINEQDIKKYQYWEQQLKSEKEYLEEELKQINLDQGIKNKYSELEDQAILLKNKCFQYNTQVSKKLLAAEPQEEMKLKSKLINFEGKTQPQDVENNKWIDMQKLQKLQECEISMERKIFLNFP